MPNRAKAKKEALTSLPALHMHGDAHTDVRAANVLWNNETGRVTLIDFEQAQMIELSQQALSPLVLNKRLWRVEVEGGKATEDKRKLEASGRLKMQQDILDARILFYIPGDGR